MSHFNISQIPANNPSAVDNNNIFYPRVTSNVSTWQYVTSQPHIPVSWLSEIMARLSGEIKTSPPGLNFNDKQNIPTYQPRVSDSDWAVINDRI